MDKAVPGGSRPDVSRERKSARVPLKAEVRLRRSGQSNYLVNVHDISPEGCRLEFVEKPRLDETVWIKFDRLDAIEAIVCWLKGSDVGIEFARPIHAAVFDVLVKRFREESAPPPQSLDMPVNFQFTPHRESPARLGKASRRISPLLVTRSEAAWIDPKPGPGRFSD